ncbi:C1 family peptidase [Fluviicola sp.]|uniref:C1 family peptidase n=1 Tax=Fluviicola sp. TaxID=1917219 RepID=UPI002629BEFB|nr:C1 family peptidase [Fluviicola sp.]
MRKIIFLSIACIYNIYVFSQNDFGYGLKLPTEEQIKSVPYTPGFSLPSSIVLPSKVDLSDKMPPIGNQGYQGSCTAFAVAYAAKSYQEKRQHNWLFIENEIIRNDRICSPSFIFNIVKFRNQNYNCLEGIWFWEAFEMLNTTGTSFLSAFPYDEQDCSAQPSPTVIQNATINKISTYKSLSFQNLDEVKYNLFVGNPIIIGFNNCDYFQPDGFDAYRRGINYTYVPKGLLNPKNYHAMVCVGYNEQTQSFKIMNSWGNNWGNSGYFNVSYKLFSSLVAEAYTINDAWSPGTFVSVTTKETETTKSFTSNSLYSSWFKEGYYREFKRLRIGLTALSPKDSSATVIFTDLQKNEIINTIRYRINTPQTFYYEDQRITFTLLDIAKAGRNPLTKAAYFDLSIDNSIDTDTKEKIDKINILKEQKNLYDKLMQQQNQFLEKND